MSKKESNITTVWGIPEKFIPIIDDKSKAFELKHGMFSSIPILCRGKKCPYRETCSVNELILPEGSRCPIEVAAIISRFEHWCNHFGIETTDDNIDDKHLVDATLIKDLVENEIQILRAENKIALSGDFIARTISTVDSRGKAYYKDEVSPEATFKLNLLDKKYKILQLLNSTRKDKKDLRVELTPSQQAMSSFKEISEKLKSKEKGE